MKDEQVAQICFNWVRNTQIFTTRISFEQPPNYHALLLDAVDKLNDRKTTKTAAHAARPKKFPSWSPVEISRRFTSALRLSRR